MTHVDLLNEARYAERLCARTARLYRRAQSVGVFVTVLGGSAAVVSLSGKVPDWLTAAGVACFAVFGAALLAIRPADKAASNEADARRYAKLRSDAASMSVEQLAVALNKARETDTSEIEPLRDVAYNDVVREIGRPDVVLPLNLTQRLLAALA